MNNQTSLSEEKQLIFYEFVKKLYHLLYKQIPSNCKYDCISVFSHLHRPV